MNTFYSCYDNKKLRYNSGEFTSTVRSSIIMSGTNYPEGISGTDTNTVAHTATRLWLYSGQITSTIKTSISHTSLMECSVIPALDYIANRSVVNKWFWYSGLFSTTIRTSQAAWAWGTGISSDENGNTFYCNSNSDTLYQYSGMFTSTLKTYLNIISKESSVQSISTNNTDTIFCGNIADRLYRLSGIITSTVKSSLPSQSINPHGIESDKIVLIPDPPILLDAADGIEETVITFSSCYAATSYNLYWSLSPGVTTLDNQITGVTSPYTHNTMVTFGVPYYYVVTAVGVGGESGISNEESATPQAGTVDAPTNLEAESNICCCIELTWDAVSGAASYNLYWSLFPGVTTSDNQITGILTNSYSHCGLKEGTTYYYIVTAVGSTGIESTDTSNEASATCVLDVTEYANMLWHLLPKGRFWQK